MSENEMKIFFKKYLLSLNKLELNSEDGLLKTKTDLIDVDERTDLSENIFEISMKTYELKIGGEDDDDNNDSILEDELINNLSQLINSDAKLNVIEAYGSEKGYWYIIVEVIKNQ